MNSLECIQSERKLRVWHVVISCMLLFFAMGLIVATGYFRLSPESAALRSGLLQSGNIPWNKKIALHFGPLTMGMLRNVLLFIHMKPEPRAGIEALRAVEAGVYQMPSSLIIKDYAPSLLKADKVMASRNWERLVYVVHEDTLVAVYTLKKRIAAKTMKCCFVVLHEKILVVGSASIKPESLLKLVNFDERRWVKNYATAL